MDRYILLLTVVACWWKGLGPRSVQNGDCFSGVLFITEGVGFALAFIEVVPGIWLELFCFVNLLSCSLDSMVLIWTIC